MGMEFITVRAGSETVQAFDKEAKNLGMSRSELLRELMIAVKDCRGILSAKRMEKYLAFKNLEDRAAEWLMENMPDNLNSEQMYVLGGVFHCLADEMMRIRGPDVELLDEEQIVDTVAKIEPLNEEE